MPAELKGSRVLLTGANNVGAGGLRPVLDTLSSGGIAGHFGFGWFGSYIVMSGSPVAAVAMSLFAGGAITDLEAFAMINGSRMGASLIVLVVGFVSYVTGHRNPDGLYIGVVALLNPDWAWAFTERTNSVRGQVAERTDTWEQGNRIGAVISIVAGGGLVLLSFAK